MKLPVFKILLAYTLLAGASYASASEYEVNSYQDVMDANPGDGICSTVASESMCTLRAAVQETNAYPGLDSIVLPAGTYTLKRIGLDSSSDDSVGDIDITDHLVIKGAGREDTVIQAGASMGELRDRVFDIATGAHLEISGVTIENGFAPQTKFPDTSGGAIRSRGNFTLRDCIVQNNFTPDGTDGGAIYQATGKGIIENCIFRENNTGTGGAGGAIFSESQLNTSLAVRNSEFRKNSAYNGGAVSGGRGTIIENSLLEENSARVGGAIGGDGVQVVGSTMTANRATTHGGGYYAYSGSARIIDSEISNNTAAIAGGGVYLNNAYNAVIENSLISENRSTQGAGVASEQGMVNINQSTVTLNSAIDLSSLHAPSGGGLWNGQKGNMFLNNVTLYDNSGSNGNNIFSSPISDGVLFRNSIVGGVGTGANCDGETTIHSLGSNIETGDSCGFNQQGDLVDTAPLIGELADNGGATLTRAIAENSPAVDAGAEYGCRNSYHTAVEISDIDALKDQRGAGRVIDGDDDAVSTCDIGAYEFIPYGSNSLPIARAGEDLVVMPGATVTLDGGRSHDFEATLESFAWQQTVGTPVTLAQHNQAVTSFQAPEESATLTFSLLVSDAATASSEDNVDVFVNVPPVANAGEDFSLTNDKTGVFDGSKSADIDGYIRRYDWKAIWGVTHTALGDYTGQSLAVPMQDLKANASNVYRLTVTDDKGFSDTDLAVVHFLKENNNTPPLADAGEDIAALSGELIQLDGSLSSDSDGHIDQYHWISEDNIRIWNKTESRPAITAPLEEGVYKLDLVVVDDGNLAAADSVVIKVVSKRDETSHSNSGSGTASHSTNFAADLPFSGGGALGWSVLVLLLARVYFRFTCPKSALTRNPV